MNKTLEKTDRAALEQSAERTLSAYSDGIAALAGSIKSQLGAPFAQAVDVIGAAQGRLIVSGMGKSGHIARKIAATFASTGTPAFFVHPSEASHGDLGMVTSQDVILALSWSGETVELKNLIAYSRRFRISLVAMTANSTSSLAKASDVVLLLPQVREACPHNLAPTTSSMMQLALGDALAVALLEARGFSAMDFGALHPGGSLGSVLKLVRDVMHGKAETPIIDLNARMADAVVEMSAKGFGCVGITDPAGRLVGIVTDGDLRRHMSPDLLQRRVDEVMTKNPKTARPDQLASEALRLINVAKVNALIVIDEDQPVGIIRVHDILRAGIM